MGALDEEVGALICGGEGVARERCPEGAWSAVGLLCVPFEVLACKGTIVIPDEPDAWKVGAEFGANGRFVLIVRHLFLLRLFLLLTFIVFFLLFR